MVLTLRGDQVVAITGFPDTSVFASFGLPRTLSDGHARGASRGQ